MKKSSNLTDHKLILDSNYFFVNCSSYFIFVSIFSALECWVSQILFFDLQLRRLTLNHDFYVTTWPSTINWLQNLSFFILKLSPFLSSDWNRLRPHDPDYHRLNYIDYVLTSFSDEFLNTGLLILTSPVSQMVFLSELLLGMELWTWISLKPPFLIFLRICCLLC